MIVMLLVTGYPIVYAIILSLQKYDLRFPSQRRRSSASRTTATCSRSSTWWTDVFNTLVITVFSVGIELVLGMLIALVMHRAIFGRGAVRAAVLIPYGIVTVVAAFAWLYAFQPTSGFVPGLLGPVVRPVRIALGLVRRDHHHRGLEDDAVHGAAAAWRAWRWCPTSCTRPRRSTAPARGSASGGSRCR